MSMEALLLAAWIDGLYRMHQEPAVRPAERPARLVRIHGPGRAPYVPLRPRTVRDA